MHYRRYIPSLRRTLGDILEVFRCSLTGMSKPLDCSLRDIASWDRKATECKGWFVVEVSWVLRGRRRMDLLCILVDTCKVERGS